MKIRKFLLVKAFLTVAGILGANGINNAEASVFDGVAKDTNISNMKQNGVQYAGCIFDSIFNTGSANDDDDKY